MGLYLNLGLWGQEFESRKDTCNFVQSIEQGLQRGNWVILKLSLLKCIHEKRTSFVKIHIEYLNKDYKKYIHYNIESIKKNNILCLCHGKRDCRDWTELDVFVNVSISVRHST